MIINTQPGVNLIHLINVIFAVSICEDYLWTLALFNVYSGLQGFLAVLTVIILIEEKLTRFNYQYGQKVFSYQNLEITCFWPNGMFTINPRSEPTCKRYEVLLYVTNQKSLTTYCNESENLFLISTVILFDYFDNEIWAFLF